MKPITKPELAEKISNRTFPEFVIQAFNECIEESKIKGSSNVLQDDVVNRIVKLTNVTRHQIFENHWLDVEDTFRAAGWKVSFYKPSYNESGESYFTFR